MAPVLKLHEIPLSRHESPNDPAFLELMEKADLMVSIACPKILKKATFELPPKGSINYHTGALPRFRGRQPLYWAMLNGEDEVGITVHRMAEEVDAGPILHQEMVNIEGIKSLHHLYLKTLPFGASALATTIRALSREEETESPNPVEAHPPNPFPGKEEGRTFRSKGLRII